MGKYAEIQQHILRQNQYTEQAKEEFVQLDSANPPNVCRTFEVECS
jgi:hypothetical protein